MDGQGNLWVFALRIVTAALLFFVLFRFGLVATVLTVFSDNLFANFPITLDASAWYSGVGYAVLMIFAAFVLYAFRTSLGGRPLFSAPHLDD